MKEINGIAVEKNYNMQQKSKSFKDEVIYLGFSFAGVFGAIQGFLSSFDIKIWGSADIVWVLALCTVFYILFNKIFQRYNLKIKVAVPVIVMLCGIVILSFLRYSFLGMLNDLNIGFSFEEVLPSRMFLVYSSIIVVMLVQLLLSFKVNWAAYLTVILLMLPEMLSGKNPPVLSVVGIAVFIICTGLYDRQKNYYYPVAVAVIMFALSIVLIILFPDEKYSNKNSFEDLFKQDKIEDQKPQEYIAVGGLSGGKIGGYEKVQSYNIKLLNIVTGSQGDIYLKGYMGSNYADSSWRGLSDEDYKQYPGLFEDDKIISLSLYNQTANILNLMDSDKELIEKYSGEPKDYLKMVTKRQYSVMYTEAASKDYWYMPYGNTYFVSNKSENDGYPLDCEKGYISSEQYFVNDIDYDKFKTIIDDAYDNKDADKYSLNVYLVWERKYREFVYAKYTGVDENLSKILRDTPKLSNEIVTQQDKLDYVETVKKYLSENYSYTLEPGKAPEGTDSIDYFLNGNKKGYCAHFATTGALILKEAGIPARYVEGFCVNTDSGRGSTVSQKRTSGAYGYTDTYTSYEIDVYDNNAHAWVEIYMDGYGWIPVDFTPGYQNISQTVIVNPDELEYSENDADSLPEEGWSAPGVIVQVTPKDYDSISEYMKDNRTGIIDFSIVIPIIIRKITQFLILMLKIALVFAVICVIIYIPSYFAHRKNVELFRYKPDNTPIQDKQQVLAIYNYIDKLCGFLKIGRTSSMSYLEYSKVMEKSKEYFKEAEVYNIIYCVEKCVFGHGNIGITEMKKVIEAVNMINKKSYESLSKTKKILYRFFWHLY